MGLILIVGIIAFGLTLIDLYLTYNEFNKLD